MTRRGQSISTSTKLAKLWHDEMTTLNPCKPYLYLFSFCFVLLACGAQAPSDYYFQFALMEEWGEHNRQQTGRTLDVVITHPENAEPLILAFEIGDSPAELLGFKALESPERKSSGQPRTVAVLSKVRISLNQNAIDRIFSDQEIQVAYWQLHDGRLEGKQNVVTVHFIPRALTDRAIQTEFLMICAIVHGGQVEDKNTIDVIKGIAAKEDGTPLMALEGQTVNYKAYIDEQIGLQEWANRLKMRRF